MMERRLETKKEDTEKYRRKRGREGETEGEKKEGRRNRDAG